MPRRRCYSFEPSGHNLKPLDTMNDVVMRLYCPSCGRVIPTFQTNVEGWDPSTLPADAQNDYFTNLPSREKSDA